MLSVEDDSDGTDQEESDPEDSKPESAALRSLDRTIYCCTEEDC